MSEYRKPAASEPASSEGTWATPMPMRLPEAQRPSLDEYSVEAERFITRARDRHWLSEVVAVSMVALIFGLAVFAICLVMLTLWGLR